MAGIKCNNCGANIPAGAAFCPGCGTPKPQAPAAPQQAAPAPVYAAQPVQTQQPPRASHSIGGIFDTLFSKTFVCIFVLLGILLAWIGGIIYIFADDLNILRAGIILNSLGFLFVGVSTLMGGITNKNFDKNVRLGLIVGGSVIIVLSLAINFGSIFTLTRI